MSSTLSAVGNTSTSSAEGFSNLKDFLKDNPQIQGIIEQGIRAGSVCSINLSDLSLDTDLDPRPQVSASSPGSSATGSVPGSKVK